MKTILISIMLLTSIVALSGQRIIKVDARQIRPWAGFVELTYELEDDITPAEGMVLTAKIVCKDREHDRQYDVTNLIPQPTLTKGRHRVVWNAKKEGVSFCSKDVVFTVYIEENRALYCVVDIEAGSNASVYPVSYIRDVPEGGWTKDHRTNKLVLRYVEPGSFKMQGVYDVQITKPFYIGVFEVTECQYYLITGGNPAYHWDGRSSIESRTQPIENVSWNGIRGSSGTYNWPSNRAVQANSFMGKLQRKTGRDFDLPTDAQWEYACRAGTSSPYNNGSFSSSDLNYLGQSYGTRLPIGLLGVGGFLPNSWGLYDMHGNVWEWCLDWDGALQSGERDPEGADIGTSRVIRGGSYLSLPDACTSSARGALEPSQRATYGNKGDVGFRVVLPCL